MTAKILVVASTILLLSAHSASAQSPRRSGVDNLGSTAPAPSGVDNLGRAGVEQLGTDGVDKLGATAYPCPGSPCRDEGMAAPDLTPRPSPGLTPPPVPAPSAPSCC